MNEISGHLPSATPLFPSTMRHPTCSLAFRRLKFGLIANHPTVPCSTLVPWGVLSKFFNLSSRMKEIYLNGSLGLDVDNIWELPFSTLVLLDLFATWGPDVFLPSSIAFTTMTSAPFTPLKESLQLNGMRCSCLIGSGWTMMILTLSPS